MFISAFFEALDHTDSYGTVAAIFNMDHLMKKRGCVPEIGQDFRRAALNPARHGYSSL